MKERAFNREGGAVSPGEGDSIVEDLRGILKEAIAAGIAARNTRTEELVEEEVIEVGKRIGKRNCS